MNRQFEKNEKDYIVSNKRRRGAVVWIALIIAVVMLVWTVAGSLISVYGAEVKKASVSTDGMRGVWVSTVLNLDYPSSPTIGATTLKGEADNIIAEAKSMGMNAIFLQVRPSADAIYPTSYYPWSRYLTGRQGEAPSNGFDPLAYWVKAAHASGIELHAWINPYRVTRSGDADWTSLAANNPAKGVLASYVIKNGKDYYFDPGEPAVRQYIIDSSVEIVKNYDVDGIHLDDYFYPGTDFNDTASFAKYGSGYSLADWRRNNVNQLINQLDTALHNAKKNISFGISPSGIWANKSSNPLGSNTKGKEHYSALYSDSVAWIKNGWVDYIAPQIYWSIGYNVADYKVLAEWWNGIVAGTDVSLYIGMADYRSFGVKDTSSVWYGTSELSRQLAVNRSLPNVKGEIHFRHKLMTSDSGIVNLYKNHYGNNNSQVTDNGNNSAVNNGNNSAVNNGNSTGNNVSDGVIDDKPKTDKGNSANNGKVNTGNDNVSTKPATSQKYNDIKGNWAEHYIMELSDAGIISGMGDGSFKPNDSVTRAQFVKLTALAVSGGVIDDVKSAGFKDVKKGSWYEVYINWAANKGIVSGMEDNTFHPNDKITREQMAVIVQNLASASGVEFTGIRDGITFKDRELISEWAEEAVHKSVEAGILSGMTESGNNGAVLHYFRPKADTTRAQAAKVINIIRSKMDKA